MAAATVVFDLDGTLVDTAPDLIHAANHALGAAGLGPVPGETLRPFISFGSRRMIVEGLAWHGRQLAEAEIDAMWHGFLDFYGRNIAVDSRPFPQVESVLDRLAERGVQLAVCTNKVEALSRQLLATLGLERRFVAICGRDTFPVCKPHPEHLVGTIRAGGGDPTRAVLVGDSDTDVATAKAAGIPIVGVTFGYTDVPMHTLEPDAVIDHYSQLEGALATLRIA
jgi:phosphoglycolate phosphatase